MKSFGPSPTIFRKLNGNDLLMANILNSTNMLKVLLCHKYFWSIHFRQWNDSPFKFFLNLQGNTFCFFTFSKWKKYYNFTFDDIFKMYRCALCSINLNSSSINKSFLNQGPLNIPFHFCRILVYLCLNEAFFKNLKKKTIIFWYKFPNLFKDVVYYRILEYQSL